MDWYLLSEMSLGKLWLLLLSRQQNHQSSYGHRQWLLLSLPSYQLWASDLYQGQMKEGVVDWDILEHASIQHAMRDESQAGGIYVRLFLKDSKLPLGNTKRFLEGLLDQYVLSLAATHYDKQVDSELPLLLSAALVSLLQMHSALVGYLGYVPKLVVAMAYEGRRETMASTVVKSGSHINSDELNGHVGYLGYVPKLVVAMAYEGRQETMASTVVKSGSHINSDELNGKGDGQSDFSEQILQERVRLSCLLVLHQLVSSTTCAEAMAATRAGTPQARCHQFLVALLHTQWVLFEVLFAFFGATMFCFKGVC